VAKALKNEDAQKLMKLLSSKGYVTDLKNTKVGKIFSENEVYRGVIIPMSSKNGKAELIYILANGVSRIGAVEVLNSGERKSLTLYYIDENDNIKTVTAEGSQNCWDCIWQCTGECIVEQCLPQTPGLCSLCYPLLQACLLVPGPENPSCEGALICYGSFAVGCFCWCTYHCNKDLGQYP
jgi:hypothetical protein